MISEKRLDIYRQMVFDGASLLLLQDLSDLLDYLEGCLEFLDEHQAHYDSSRLIQMKRLLSGLKLRGHTQLGDAYIAAGENHPAAKAAYASWLRRIEEAMTSSLKLREEKPALFTLPPNAVSWENKAVSISQLRQLAEADNPPNFTVTSSLINSGREKMFTVLAADVPALSPSEWRSLRSILKLADTLLLSDCAEVRAVELRVVTEAE